MKKIGKKLLMKLLKAEARYGVALGRSAAKYDEKKVKVGKYAVTR